MGNPTKAPDEMYPQIIERVNEVLRDFEWADDSELLVTIARGRVYQVRLDNRIGFTDRKALEEGAATEFRNRAEVAELNERAMRETLGAVKRHLQEYVYALENHL